MRSDDNSPLLSHGARRNNRLYETFTLQLLHSQPTSDIVSILKHLRHPDHRTQSTHARSSAPRALQQAIDEACPTTTHRPDLVAATRVASAAPMLPLMLHGADHARQSRTTHDALRPSLTINIVKTISRGRMGRQGEPGGSAPSLVPYQIAGTTTKVGFP